MKRIRIVKGAVLGLFVPAAMVASFLAGAFYSGRRSSGEQTQAIDAGSKSQTPDTNFYVKSDKDGSRVVWIRASDRLTISKYDFSANGALAFKTLFKVDPQGKPIGGKVFNDRKIEVYKVSYGYRKSDGTLAEERLYDMQVAEGVPVEQPKVPVRRVIYSRDAKGRPLQSILPDPDENPQQKEAFQMLPSPFPDQVFATNINEK